MGYASVGLLLASAPIRAMIDLQRLSREMNKEIRMVVRLSKRVRLRDTHITGEIFFRFEQDGEMFYWILWDVNEDGDSELMRERELDSAERLLSHSSPRYHPTEWSDRKLQLADREFNQAIYPEPATKGYPRQRR